MCEIKESKQISAERKPRPKRLPFRAGGLQFCQPEVQTGLLESTPVTFRPDCDVSPVFEPLCLGAIPTGYNGVLDTSPHVR